MKRGALETFSRRMSKERTSKEDHARRRACLLTSRDQGVNLKREKSVERRVAHGLEFKTICIQSCKYNNADASRIPLHKVLVKVFNLADVFFHTRAERGHTEMIRALLLPEPRPCDGADPSGVYESIKKTTLATAQQPNTTPSTYPADPTHT